MVRPILRPSRPVVAVATGSALFALAACRSGAPAPTAALAPAPLAEIAAIQANPDGSGTLVYEGSVKSLDSTRTAELFRYQRRVLEQPGSVVSTHITRDPQGEVVVTQRAHHSTDYGLTSADMIQRQAGLVGTARVEGERVHFSLTKNGVTSSREERLTDPLISGPTTFGYIVANWDRLQAGESLPVRFVVLERKQSIRFRLAKEAGPAGVTVISMIPTNPLYRIAVAPTYFRFDSATRNILGYAGRVPPMERVNGKLATLDASVSYTMKATTFK